MKLCCFTSGQWTQSLHFHNYTLQAVIFLYKKNTETLQEGPNRIILEATNFYFFLSLLLTSEKQTLYRDITPLSAHPPTWHTHALTPLPGVCRGAGRNVTAITDPVVSVFGTTAATQLTFHLKAHTHAHTYTQTHTQMHHTSRRFHLRSVQSTIYFMLSLDRVHVVGFQTNRHRLFLLSHFLSLFVKITQTDIQCIHLLQHILFFLYKKQK